MANRYWAGGAGTWDNSSTTHWCASAPLILTSSSCSGTTLTTSGNPALVVGMTVYNAADVSLGTITGGSGNTWTVSIGGTYSGRFTAGTIGESAPTSSDSVFFGSGSGNITSYIVTMGVTATPATCLDFTTNGSSNPIFTSTSNVTINVYGSMALAVGSFSSAAGAKLELLATTTGKTITNAISLGTTIVNFSGVGGGWTLGSSFTTTALVTFNVGTFNTGNFNMSVSGINSNVATARSITLGTSTITLSASTTAWTFLATNLTYSWASATLSLTNASATFSGGGLIYGTVSFASTVPVLHLFQGTNTFTNLTFANKSSTIQSQVAFYANQTVTGTLTLGSPNVAGRRFFVRSDTLGTQRTLTAGTLAAMTDIDFRDIVAAGASSPWSGTRIGDCKNNSSITFTTAKTVYLSSVSGANTNWNATCWANTTGGTPDAFNFPLPQDTAIIDDSGATTGNGLRTGFTLTIDDGWNLGTVTSTRTSAYNLSQGAQDPQIYGNLTLSSGITFVGTSTPSLTFIGQNSTQTITSNGKTVLQSAVTVNSPGGTVRLLDAFTQSFSATSTGATFTLTSGTLDLNGFTLTAVAFNSSGSAVRTLAYGSTGKIVTTGGAGTSQTVFTTSTSTNLTVTGSANNECFLTSGYSNTSTIRTISPGSSTLEANSLNIYITGGGVDTVLITSTHNYRDLNTTGHGSGGILSLGTTFTSFGNLTLGTGTSIVSTTPTSQILFASTSGTKTITTNGVAVNKTVTFSGVGGTWQLANNLTSNYSNTTVNLSTGTLNLNNNNLTTGLFNSNATGVRTLTSGSGTITVTGNNGTIWNTGTATNLTYTTIPNVYATYSGSTGTRSFSTAGSADKINLNINAGSDNIAPITTFNVNDYNFTGFTGTLNSVNTNVFGSLIFSSSMTVTSGSGNYTFSSTSGTKYITCNNQYFPANVTFDGVGGTWSLQDTLSASATGTLTLTNGTLTTNSNQIYSGKFSSNNSNIRTLNLSSTSWNISGVGTIWDCENSTNLTLNWTTADSGGGGAHIYSNDTTTPAIWKGGSRAYPYIITTGTDLTFTGSNTFDYVGGFMFSNTTIRFPAGGTTTILYPLLNNGGFKGFGPTQILTLCSSTSGSNTTISKPSANDTIPFDYLSLQDISAISSASSPYAANTTIYYAGPNSISTGNVAGWSFTRGEFLQMMF